MEWTITVPETTGPGAITHFTVYVDSNAVVNTNGTVMSYIIRNLAPYQLVTVQVSASTSAGEGVRSEAVDGRSSEARKRYRIGMITSPVILWEVILLLQYNIVYSCTVAEFHYSTSKRAKTDQRRGACLYIRLFEGIRLGVGGSVVCATMANEDGI